MFRLVLSESILGPIWVWIGVGEKPSTLTLAGSGVVLVSVAAYCIHGIRAERRLLRAAARLGAGAAPLPAVRSPRRDDSK